MKSRDWVFIAIVVVVVGGLYLLSQRSSRIPSLPVNQIHAEAKTREQCLTCHTPEKLSALETARKHPLKWRDAKINCTQCHQHAQPQTSNLSPPFTEQNLPWLKQQ